MNYTFFIQPTKGGTESSLQDQPYKFILLPDHSRVSIPDEDFQRLIRLNSVQTFLNLELSDKIRPNFKGSYVKLGTRIYPLIVVATEKDGAFRIPFGPGKEGLEEMKRTFREIQIAFKRFENRRLAQLQNDSAKRLGAGEPPKEEVELFEKEIKDIGSKGGWTPRTADAEQAKDTTSPVGGTKTAANKGSGTPKQPNPSDNPASEGRASPRKRPAPRQDSRTVAGRKPVQRPSPTRKTSSLVKAMVVGSAISIAVIGLLVATDARAADDMDKPTEAVIIEDESALPAINLDIRIDNIAPAKAASSVGCTLGFGTTSESKPRGLGTGFEGLQIRLNSEGGA